MILLDTHVIAWLAAEPHKLSRPAASAIRRARASDGLAVSDVTLWELASLIARGVLRLPGTIEDAVENLTTGAGLTVLPITAQSAALATQFPESFSKDPSDRLIGATARAAGLSLVTRDEKIRQSPLLRTIW